MIYEHFTFAMTRSQWLFARFPFEYWKGPLLLRLPHFYKICKPKRRLWEKESFQLQVLPSDFNFAVIILSWKMSFLMTPKSLKLVKYRPLKQHQNYFCVTLCVCPYFIIWWRSENLRFDIDRIVKRGCIPYSCFSSFSL